MTTATFRWLSLVLLLVLGAAGVSDVQARKPSGKKLDVTLFEYSSSLRWSEFEAAWAYVEPAYREQNPLSEFELERFKQFQITGYEVKTRDGKGKLEYAQTVEIRLVNKHTQTERVITERELWRWDAASKRWWLATGLPKLSRD